MTLKVEVYKSTPTRKTKAPLFRKKQDILPVIIKDDAEHISKNIELGKITKIILRTCDYLNPLLNKYPCIAPYITKLGEKLLRFSSQI